MNCIWFLNKYKNNKKDLHFWEKLGIIIKNIIIQHKSGKKAHSFDLKRYKTKKGGTMANIEEKVENLLKPIIENLGYELYDVEYAKEGKNYYLRIFIDSEKGIDLNDCEKVSNNINDKLDEVNYIKEQYYLEVSSPRNRKNSKKR